MARILEQFIRGSDNQIKLALTEDGSAVFGAWTGLEIHFAGVVLERSASGDGVELSESTGVLTITPANLLPDELTAIEAIPEWTYHRVQIIVTGSLNDDGAVFGGSGSTSIIFHISDKPVAA